ncbi:MAG: hypothetical protein D6797_02290 [Bdellovibrio sp.]|nr:MAG: hypothetical protein D6797_02290 [Bdellovibrio sp.]
MSSGCLKIIHSIEPNLNHLGFILLFKKSCKFNKIQNFRQIPLKTRSNVGEKRKKLPLQTTPFLALNASESAINLAHPLL